MEELELIKKFIIKNGVLQSFKTGELILSTNKKNENLYLIESGEARIIFCVNNKRSTFKKLQPGDFIGISSLFTGKQLEEVRSSGSVKTYTIEKNILKKFILGKKSLIKFFNSILFDEEIAYLLKDLISSSDNKNNLKLIFDNLIEYTKILNTKEKINNSLKNEDFIFTYNTSSEEILIKKYLLLIRLKLLKNNLQEMSYG